MKNILGSAAGMVLAAAASIGMGVVRSELELTSPEQDERRKKAEQQRKAERKARISELEAQAKKRQSRERKERERLQKNASLSGPDGTVLTRQQVRREGRELERRMLARQREDARKARRKALGKRLGGGGKERLEAMYESRGWMSRGHLRTLRRWGLSA